MNQCRLQRGYCIVIHLRTHIHHLLFMYVIKHYLLAYVIILFNSNEYSSTNYHWKLPMFQCKPIFSTNVTFAWSLTFVVNDFLRVRFNTICPIHQLISFPDNYLLGRTVKYACVHQRSWVLTLCRSVNIVVSCKWRIRFLSKNTWRPWIAYTVFVTKYQNVMVICWYHDKCQLYKLHFVAHNGWWE